MAARWPGKAVKVFFMHADPVAVYPQTFLGGLLGPERVDRLFGFFWRYLKALNSNYDAAIVTNPALKQRFSGFGLENIEVAPFGVERRNFSPDFHDATARRVRPLSLDAWGHAWTLTACCELRDDFRAFRLDRIETAQVLEQGFRAEPGKTLGDFFARLAQQGLMGEEDRP